MQDSKELLLDLARDVEICGLDCDGDTTERRRYLSIAYRIRHAVAVLSYPSVTPSKENPAK